jgi:hypothetical protein
MSAPERTRADETALLKLAAEGDESAFREFLVRYPLTERWKHLPARANGQLAVGC